MTIPYCFCPEYTWSMKKTFRLLGIAWIVVASFGFSVVNISAGGTGLDTADYIYFRVDTEIDVPAYYGSSGATIRWSCGTVSMVL